jgi:hypothetical protein
MALAARLAYICDTPSMFGIHGTGVDLYCGEERAHLYALLDRKANQQRSTPRIYGKPELAN